MPSLHSRTLAFFYLVSRVLAASADGHGSHSHYATPLMELNETLVSMSHSATPPSYWSIDIVHEDELMKGHPGIMFLHVMFMILAFFVALPVGIILRSFRSSWHGFTMLLFYANILMACVCSGLYRKFTPNMYDGSKHAIHGYLLIFAALCLSVIDIIAVIRRVFNHYKSGGRITPTEVWRAVSGKLPEHSNGPEYTGLMHAEPEETEEDGMEMAQWANNVHHAGRPAHRRRSSEVTIVGKNTEEKMPEYRARQYSHLQRVGSVAFAVAERAVVFAGYGQMVTGVVIYTGGCRAEYINGCLAHLIKGSIFLLYGLVTFARYLGSFSEYGWAWNQVPAGSYLSAEFVESLVIFIYGSTNTWMERFGAHPGDPFTTKQLQHIGIALMFWFSGLVGMALESKRLRGWLAAPATARTAQDSYELEEPPSYRASFNPFPALVISLTGAVMAAHAQVYVFQVQIHMLWGIFLVAFGMLRCLTYFFLWTNPPRSVLPSRPPTEALGSFFLTCGGFVFMLSTEEVTFAAMRQGHDDMMMFLTTTVAIISLMFVWTTCVVGFKGYLSTRQASRQVTNT